MRRITSFLLALLSLSPTGVWAQGPEPRGVRCCTGVEIEAYVGYPRVPTTKCQGPLRDWAALPPLAPSAVVTIEARPRPHRRDQFAVELPPTVLEVDAVRLWATAATPAFAAGALCRDTVATASPTPEGGAFAGQAAIVVYPRAELTTGGGQVWVTATTAPGQPRVRAQRLDLARLR